MSYVCNVFVFAPAFAERKLTPALRRVWKRMDRDDTPPELLNAGECGGAKCLECDVFIGAHNYLDIELFVTELRAELGSDADGVQVCIRDQHDERFTLIDLWPGE